MKWTFPVAAGAALLMEYLLLGRRWIGLSAAIQTAVTLCLGAIGILIGCTLWWMTRRVLRPAGDSHGCFLSVMSGFASGLVTFFLSWMLVAPFAWDWLHLRGDLEAYMWLTFLASVLSAVLAVPFGCGLGQPGWQDREAG